MAITISPLTEPDIEGAITAIQVAFAEDPYNLWVYNDRTKVSPSRLSLSRRPCIAPRVPDQAICTFVLEACTIPHLPKLERRGTGYSHKWLELTPYGDRSST